MQYQSPQEEPRGRFARFAVRAGTPYWASLVGGMLPAFIWAVANAWFLGCRDARRQTIVALVAYVLISMFGFIHYEMWFRDLFPQLFGKEGRLVYWVTFSLQIIASLIVLRYLAGRQITIASYRSSLGKGLPWAIWLIVLLGLSEHYVRQYILDWGTPHIAWIWLPSVLW